MKKVVKMVSSFLVIALILNLFCMSSFATTVSDRYQAILSSINKEYDLELGYVPIDPNTVSLEEYEKITTDTAIQQRAMLDRIAQREASSLLQPSTLGIAPLSILTVTKTNDVWDLSTYEITLTYNFNESTHQCTSPRNASIGIKWILIPISNTSFAVTRGPSYKFLDASRTIAVTFIGTLRYNNSGVEYTNYTAYSEFAGK